MRCSPFPCTKRVSVTTQTTKTRNRNTKKDKRGRKRVKGTNRIQKPPFQEKIGKNSRKTRTASNRQTYEGVKKEYARWSKSNALLNHHFHPKYGNNNKEPPILRIYKVKEKRCKRGKLFRKKAKAAFHCAQDVCVR
eukprot:TRINITY_DN655_c0_g1_i1.p1 TRINITY_DN655_c0_g1~~TRINITY_DN655_c0_g1_i1.p1  ORF type:complete len:136 (-),score=8.79 TRINITY_DN655_c0_g1_i1:103-510(-)